MAGPNLVPVDHDPFAGAPATPKLTPVDHDPFAKSYGIDFSQPVEHVRGKIDALPEAVRGDATKQWAKAYVANENAQGGIGQAADNTIRTLARGTLVGPFLDEISAGTSALQHKIGLGGAPYDEALAYQRARDAYVDEKYPVTSTVGKLAGGVAGVGGAIRSGGGALSTAVAGPIPAAAPTVVGRIGQAAAVGAGTGAVHGFGDSEGGLGNRTEGALKGGAIGIVLGTGLGAIGEGVRVGAHMIGGRGQNGAYQKAAEALEEAPAGTMRSDQLANQYAQGATTASLPINRRTLDILGEEMERAAGDRAAAIPATVQRIATEFGVTPATAQSNLRSLARVNQDNPLFFGEFQATAGSNAAMRGPNGGRINPATADLDELGRVRESGLANQLDYLANNGNATSATVTRNAIRERQDVLADQMRSAIDSLPPTRANGVAAGGTPQIAGRAADIVDTGNMVEAARQIGGQEYRAAYAGPTNNNALVSWLPRLLGRYDQMAAGRSGEYADAMRRAADQFYLQTPNGRVAMGTLQQLQDARGAVRGQMEGYARNGRDDLSRVIRPLYDQITRLMEFSNPRWGVANRRWADMNFLRTGQELGDAFAQKAGPRFREQLQEFQQLAPEAQNIVRVHFLQQIRDKIENAGDMHSLSKFFASDHQRAAIRALFGDEAAVSFTRAVRDQKAAEQTQAMLANSKTHRRGQTQKQMDTETGLIAAAENASVKGTKSAILDWMAQRITEGRNRPLADILTTPANDTAAAARHIHRLRQAEQRQRAYETSRPRYLGPVSAASGTAGSLVASGRGMGGTQPRP